MGLCWKFYVFAYAALVAAQTNTTSLIPVAEETVATPAPAIEACADVTEELFPGCYGNVTWAMVTGAKEYPTWYANYPILGINQSFQAYQYVLAQKVGKGTGTREGSGWHCPPPCNFKVPVCADVTAESPGMCYENLLWAKETGIETQPELYADYPRLTAASELADFQYVLHQMALEKNSQTGWQCPMPCTSELHPITPAPTPVVTQARAFDMTTISTTTWTTWTTTSTTTTSTEEAGSSIPWWAWLLIGLLGLLLCCVLPAIWYFFFKNKKATPKKAKTRATAVPQQEPGSTRILQPVVQPTVQTVPVPMAQPAPSAVPTQMAVPAYETRAMAPAPQQQFVQAYPAQQMVYAAQPDPRAQASALFDQMDINHDGVITRAEFNRMMYGQ